MYMLLFSIIEINKCLQEYVNRVKFINIDTLLLLNFQ